MAEKMKTVQYFTTEGYPHLVLEGGAGLISNEDAYRWLVGRGMDATGISSNVDGKYSWTHPDGRVFENVTGDKEIVALARRFIKDMEEHPELFEEGTLRTVPANPLYK